MNSKLCEYSIDWDSISNYSEINTLTTNTKTRRLGYLKLLALFFTENEQVSKPIFASKFESFVQDFKGELLQYKNSKGVIGKTHNGSSAEPYIDLADNLSIIKLSGNKYSPGKSFQVYLKCANIWTTDYFFVRQFDRMYFFYTIFYNDFFFLKTILESIYGLGYASYSTLRKKFYKYLLEKLNTINLKNLARSTRSKNLRIEKRIKNWEKPEIYLEHILMPRLNWLFDLDLIELDKNLNIIHTQFGEILFANIKFWDSALSKPLNDCTQIFEHDFLKIYRQIFDNNINFQPLVLQNEQHIEFIKKLINSCFEYFSTLAPNRVTLSQVDEYVKYNLYWEKNIILDTVKFRNLLKNKLSNSYIYKYFPKYKEGYIQKI